MIDTDKLIENAACCSQRRELLDEDGPLRECIQLNIVNPMKAEIERLTAQNFDAKSDWMRDKLKRIDELEAENERLRAVYEAARNVDRTLSQAHPGAALLRQALAAKGSDDADAT